MATDGLDRGHGALSKLPCLEFKKKGESLLPNFAQAQGIRKPPRGSCGSDSGRFIPCFIMLSSTRKKQEKNSSNEPYHDIVTEASSFTP